MRSETFDFISNFSTLGAVVLGAVLAMVGGIAATQMEAIFERRRRERQAALFFGEVLTTLSVILNIAHRTYAVGDPFGPITVRMLRSARREIDIYERNRETLYELRDAALRARIHSLVVRLSTPLDGVFDSIESINALEAQLRRPELSDAERQHAEERLARLKTARIGGYEAAMEAAAMIPELVERLSPYARQKFDAMSAAVPEAQLPRILAHPAE